MSENKKSDRFQRDIYPLFGIPIDNLSFASTKKCLRAIDANNGPRTLSTINLNWIAQSLNDHEFKESIVNSDMVVIDGKPLLWLSKMMGYPLSETVPGSSLVQSFMLDEERQPFTMFLFGGGEGVGGLAMKIVNEHNGGLRVVGALNPGFGTIEDMSTQEIISTINNTKPDILLVALGAKKGVQWIEKNKGQLKVGTISHLGATINFLAGSVKRAPVFFQQTGLEWAWRICQEPKLFSRYVTDGWLIFRILLKGVKDWFFYKIHMKKYSSIKNTSQQGVVLHDDVNSLRVEFSERICLKHVEEIRDIFTRYADSEKAILFDFKNTEFIDGAFAGLLVLFLYKRTIFNLPIELNGVGRNLDKLFKLYGIPF